MQLLILHSAYLLLLLPYVILQDVVKEPAFSSGFPLLKDVQIVSQTFEFLTSRVQLLINLFACLIRTPDSDVADYEPGKIVSTGTGTRPAVYPTTSSLFSKQSSKHTSVIDDDVQFITIPMILEVLS